MGSSERGNETWKGNILENLALPQIRYIPAMASSALALAIVGLVQGVGEKQGRLSEQCRLLLP